MNSMLDVNQEKNILDEIVVTKFNLIPSLLQIIRESPNISQNKIRIKSKYSSGKVHHSIKAMKLMGFVKNGDGITITEFGSIFLNELNKNGRLPKEIIKDSCFRVPLFNKVYNENIELKDPKKIYNIFKSELNEKYPNVNERIIGSAVRRYFEGIHNIHLRAGARLKEENKIEKNEKKTIRNNSNNKNIQYNLVESLKVAKEIQEQPLKLSIKKYGRDVIKEIIPYL